MTQPFTSITLTDPIHYAHLQVTLTPPEASAQPAITALDALERCLKLSPGIPPEIFLAQATMNARARIADDGRIERTVDNTLVYAVRWPRVPCPPDAHGGPLTRDPRLPTTASAPTGFCLVLAMVDAMTGVAYGSFRTPSLTG